MIERNKNFVLRIKNKEILQNIHWKDLVSRLANVLSFKKGLAQLKVNFTLEKRVEVPPLFHELQYHQAYKASCIQSVSET